MPLSERGKEISVEQRLCKTSQKKNSPRKESPENMSGNIHPMGTTVL